MARDTSGFTIWPIAGAILFPVVLALLWSGPFDLAFIGAPLLLLIWALSALLALGLAIASTRARNWRRAISWSVLPVVTLVALANADTVWRAAMYTGERLHFEALRHSYLEDVSKLPQSDEPRFAMWRWGGFTTGHAVVFDESDEIAQPEQSPAWKKRVGCTEVGMCGVWGTPLGDHFYLVGTGC